MFPLRKFLAKVWQGQEFEIGEVISFLELSGADADTLADVLNLLAEKKISVNRAEERLEEAKRRCRTQ